MALWPHSYAVGNAGKVYDNANPRSLREHVDKSEAVDKAVSFEGSSHPFPSFADPLHYLICTLTHVA